MRKVAGVIRMPATFRKDSDMKRLCVCVAVLVMAVCLMACRGQEREKEGGEVTPTRIPVTEAAETPTEAPTKEPTPTEIPLVTPTEVPTEAPTPTVEPIVLPFVPAL